MAVADTTLSLTPPGTLSRGERVGQSLLGVGLVALMIAFLGAYIPPLTSMAFALLFLVSGGVLLSRGNPSYRRLSRGLIGMGVLAFLLMLLAQNGIFSLTKLAMQQDDAGHKVGADPVMWAWLGLVVLTLCGGCILYFRAKWGSGPAGIRNNGIMHSETTRQQGVLSWMLAIMFTGFYVVLYWFPENLNGLMELVKPLKRALTGNEGSAQWFLYGLTYTLLVIVMGIRYIYKYRHNRYQKLRTVSVMFFQLTLAFLVPSFLENLNTTQVTAFEPFRQQYQASWDSYDASKQAYYKAKGDNSPELAAAEAAMNTEKAKILGLEGQLEAAKPKIFSHYFSYFFPLDYDAVFPSNIKGWIGARDEMGVIQPWNPGYGAFGWWVLWIGLGMSTVGVVTLTYFFGKRWYCSWVCGCGGLAETAGDPFRQMSDKSLKAWQVERVLIYSVLALITGTTALLLLDWKLGFLGEGFSGGLKSGYGFVISSCFAGVVGTGFYPILGSRVWCRFGCPQAAVLGILQKYFSRFRITTNGGQCISCGNCSTYCEMGIDVKAYAQRGENVVRASCVGCGVCSAVCPRGVLNLENGPLETRFNGLQSLLDRKGRD